MWHKRSDTVLVEAGDRTYFDRLFATPAFRELLEDPTTGYGVLLDQASLRPWWFVSAQQPYERYHFSAWIGDTFLRRTYDNPVITDMYYWHDLVHAMTFRLLDPHIQDFQSWRLAMRSNEIAVSIETEMLIYLRNPSLRAHTFDQIWLDDLTDPLPERLATRLEAYRARLQEDEAFATSEYALRSALPEYWPLFHPIRALEQGRDFNWFWDLRRAVTLWPDENNAMEMALHKYEAQANPFYQKWTHHWREVENHRLEFANLIKRGAWREAVELRHKLWDNRADSNGVPYGDLAPRPKKRKA